VTTLAARDLIVDMGGQRLLDGIDLELCPGVVTLLAGRNGSGKTTLLNVLTGLRRPESGTVLLDDRECGSITPRDRAQKITMIPQDSDSPFEFTGRELVMMGRHPHIPRFGTPGPRDYEVVERALQLADAEEFADRSTTTLSGGERRRITIARAIATEAQVLLADEPTANLDLDHALAALEMFRGLAQDGKTILLVSHDINLVAPHCDHAVLLHSRRIRVGPPEQVLSAETMREVFAVRSSPPETYFPRSFSKL